MTRRLLAVFLTISGLACSPVSAEEGASFVCESQDNGKAAPATFRLMAGGQEILSGSCGAIKAIPVGSYEALIVLDGALDLPTYREQLTALPGKTVRVKARYETGELVVDVTRDGRRSVGMVRLFREGKPFASVGAGSANRLSTGSYGVEVESRGEKRPLVPITIVRGERRVLVVDFAEDAGKSSQ